MVGRPEPRWRSRSGKSRLGCVLPLLLLVVGLYYGIPAGTIYVNYWRFKEEMKTQARLAPSIDNAAIRRRLRQKVEALSLPEQAKQITIQRTLRPREIVIRTTYEQTLNLPFVHRTFTLTPEVKSPL